MAGPWFLHPLVMLLVKATLVIAGAGLASILMRSGRALWRYRLWLLVFGILLVLPVLQFSGAGIRWPVFRAIPTTSVGYPEMAPSNRLDQIPAAQRTAVAGVIRKPAAVVHRMETRPVAPMSPFENGEPEVLPGSGDGWFAGSWLLAVIWLLGMLLLLIRLVAGRVQAHGLFHRGRRLMGASWRFVAQAVGRETRVRVPPRLAMHERIPVPLTFGVGRPVVLLPEGADHWTLDRRRVVLLHEYVHVRRWDDPARLSARLVAMLYWFHPLVWLAFRKLKMEQETSCDERVITAGIRPSDYAEHLVALARNVRCFKRGQPMALVGAATLGMARPRELESRLRRLLTQPPTKEAPMKRILTGLLLGVAGMVLAVQPAANAASQPEMEAPSVVTSGMLPDNDPDTPAKPEQPSAPKTAVPAPAAAPKAPKKPKAPKAPKARKDSDCNVFIVKDGKKVRKIRVKKAGENEDEMVVLSGMEEDPDGIIEEIHIDLDGQMEEVREQLTQAMALLKEKIQDLEKLNGDLAGRMAKMQIQDARVRQQLKETMANVSETVRTQLKQNEAALARLQHVLKELKEKRERHRFRWVEKRRDSDEERLQALEKREALEEEGKDVNVEVEARELRRAEEEGAAKEQEVELTRKRKRYVRVFVDRDEDSDTGDDGSVKVWVAEDEPFRMTNGNGPFKLELKVGRDGIKQSDRKRLEEAIQNLKKSIPKGAKLDSHLDTDSVSVALTVPKGTKLSKAEEKRMQEAIDRFLNRIQEIKGDKKVEVREFHIQSE